MNETWHPGDPTEDTTQATPDRSRTASATTRKAQLHQNTGAPLDRNRVIAPAPGDTPWSVLPQGERGIAQGLPVAYGANPQTAPALLTGVDEVKRELGDAPNGAPVSVREGRDVLPSLERKYTLQRVRTLVTLGVLIMASVFGLVWVASVAFG